MLAKARAQPNIAVVKYWGKRDLTRNLPAVGSISITLSTLYTEMQVEIDAAQSDDVLLVNGAGNRSMLARVSNCLDVVAGKDRPAVRVSSREQFSDCRRTRLIRVGVCRARGRGECGV